MSDVGFIGLGTMGAAMSRRLIATGHNVVVWNRSRNAVDELVAEGAIAAGRPEDALATGIVFSMLASDRATSAVFTDEMLRLRPGAVHVNMATVSLESARDLAARHERAGVGYVAAPVLGRPSLAATGQLNMVTAGADKDIERAAEFLSLLGKRMWHVGAAPAMANLVKIGVNYNLMHTLQALAESVNLVERGGVDGATFVDILTDTAYTGSAYTGYGALIAGRKYIPAAFSVALGLKDLLLTQAAAVEAGAALPTAPILRATFEAALADEELASLDWSAMAEITRRDDSALSP